MVVCVKQFIDHEILSKIENTQSNAHGGHSDKLPLGKIGIVHEKVRGSSDKKKAAEAAYIPVFYYWFCQSLLLFGKPQQDGCAFYTPTKRLRQVDADFYLTICNRITLLQVVIYKQVLSIQ